jgi:hypothetical protein
MDHPASAPRFQIFRGKDARDFGELGVPVAKEVSAVAAEGLTHYVDQADSRGQVVKLLFKAPGFSLSHVWFKSGYPLPLHSHTGDCLYYIVAGSLQIGTEVLGAGDGMFIGSDTAYTYVPGPEGVEVLEFRATDELDISFRSNSRAAWAKAAAVLAAQRETWIAERPPSEVPARA